MVGDSRVKVDGAPPEPAAKAPTSSIAVALIAFLVGLGIGVIFVGPVVDTTPSTLDSPALAEEPEPAESGPVPSEPTDLGVSEIVPDFPDALVGIGRSPGRAFEHLLWPIRGSLVARTMNGGDNVAFDRASQFIAHTSSLPDLEGLLLSMGRFTSIRPAQTGVTGFQWHDTRSGLLAFTSDSDGEWGLFRMSADLSPRPVSADQPAGTRVTAWGDWGFAVANGSQTVLLNPEGQQRAVFDGSVLASDGGGWLFASTPEPRLVSAGGGVEVLRGLEVVGSIRGARFSPNGARLAVVGTAGVAVVELADGDEIRFSGLSGSNWVEWSSDSRFLIRSAASGLTIDDTLSGASYRLLQGRTILAAGVRPLTRS